MSDLQSISNFSDPIDYLNFAFESKRLKNSHFSLRAWSRQLGYENPSFISHILKRKRKLKQKVAEKFSTNLKLTGDAKKYFELLVLVQDSRSTEEMKIYCDLLESLRSQSSVGPKALNLDAFRVIADWYHMAILEIVELHDFKNDPEYIYDRLSGEVSIEKINKAIERLLRLDLLEKMTSGKLKRKKGNSLLIESELPSDVFRHFHKQMIGKAEQAIENQSMQERDIRGSMISIRRKDYCKAQEIIKNAHAEIVKLSRSGDADDLYYFNSQFFKITKNKGEIL